MIVKKTPSIRPIVITADQNKKQDRITAVSQKTSTLQKQSDSTPTPSKVQSQSASLSFMDPLADQIFELPPKEALFESSFSRASTQNEDNITEREIADTQSQRKKESPAERRRATIEEKSTLLKAERTRLFNREERTEGVGVNQQIAGNSALQQRLFENNTEEPTRFIRAENYAAPPPGVEIGFIAFETKRESAELRAEQRFEELAPPKTLPPLRPAFITIEDIDYPRQPPPVREQFEPKLPPPLLPQTEEDTPLNERKPRINIEGTQPPQPSKQRAIIDEIEYKTPRDLQAQQTPYAFDNAPAGREDPLRLTRPPEPSSPGILPQSNRTDPTAITPQTTRDIPVVEAQSNQPLDSATQLEQLLNGQKQLKEEDQNIVLLPSKN